MATDKERARLIRRIIVANTLSLPLKRYARLIRQIEKDHHFQKLLQSRPRIITIKKFPKTLYRYASVSNSCVASIEKHSSPPLIVFHQEGLDREYTINTKEINNWTNKNSFTQSELKRIIYIANKLELISMRNRICFNILRGITHLQNNFFESGDVLLLNVLSQRELAAWIDQQSSHNPIIDESRVSRLISTLSINVDGSSEIPLKKLFPTKRGLLKHFVSGLIITEKKELESGRLKELYTDSQIALKLRPLNVSRRTIANCRKDLGIPGRHKRVKNCGYQHITQKYSLKKPLSRMAVKNCPNTSGVYELSTHGLDIEYPRDKSKVFYIGSGKNIRVRLREHMRSNTSNKAIRDICAKNKCMFRYKPACKNWVMEEKMLYRIFADTYGCPPRANKISP